MMGLTQRQADCLAAIKAHIDAHGVSPNFDELLAALGAKSKSGITRLIRALKQRGHIDSNPGAARSITLCEQLPSLRLSPNLAARLSAHCAKTGDAAADVIHDAIDLYLDQIEASAIDAVATV